MKSGLVALIGRSNAGKSTLLNSLVEKKLSATSSRAQTTRDIIHGVINTPDGQAVIVDTPGVFQLAKDILTEKLNKSVEDVLSGVDLICYVVDPTREIGEEEKNIIRILKKTNLPKIIAINKIDLAHPYREEYYQLAKEVGGEVVEISASKGTHLKKLRDLVFEKLNDGDPLYPEPQITNIDQRFWISEVIREQIFRALEQEIPYKTMVEMENISDEEKIFRVEANILTSETRHKRIIIGSDGQMIKRIGKGARQELELFLGKKVFLSLNVKVDKNWQTRI